MNVLDFEKKCSGCAACADSCEFAAITIVQDENGFYIPSIESEKCVNCSKCIKVCPVLDNETPITQREFFYGWNNDDDVRRKSSSGGLFTVFAENVLLNNGVVFGAVYSDDFKSVVIASSEDVSLTAMRTSKYVQSNAVGAYKQMEEALKNGKTVLFCGAPCQIAGAKKTFGDRYENLILVDFLCGGVPSPSVYLEYINWLERKKGAKVSSVNFRDKKNGWANANIKVDFKNGKEYSAQYLYDPYYYYYYCTYYIRNSSCIGCKFRESRYADITIADFWGFRKIQLPNDNKGMSLIITYTPKGKKFFNDIKDNLTIFKISEENGSYGFESNDKTDEELKLRDDFLNDVRKNGFIKTAKQNYFRGGKVGVVFRKLLDRISRLFVRKVSHE